MKQLFIFLVMMLLWIPLNAQTVAETSKDEDLTTFKTETDDFQNNSVDDLPWHNRKFKVTAGGFFPVNNTQVKVEGNNGNIGTEIDLESDLGFTKSSASF